MHILCLHTEQKPHAERELGSDMRLGYGRVPGLLGLLSAALGPLVLASSSGNGLPVGAERV